MLEKAITYRDFDGNERTDTFYFHLSKTDLAEWSFATMDGGLDVYLKMIIASENSTEILKAFQTIIKKSVGMKTADGRRFVKNDDILGEFLESNAYQELFMELMQRPDYAAEFVAALLPPDLAEKAVDARNEPREYSHQELLDMDDQQFSRIAGDPKHMSRDHLMIAYERKNRV